MKKISLIISLCFLFISLQLHALTIENDNFQVNIDADSTKIFSFLTFTIQTAIPESECRLYEIKELNLKMAQDWNSPDPTINTGKIEISVVPTDDYFDCQEPGLLEGEFNLFLGNELPAIRPGRWQIRINDSEVGHFSINRGFEVGNG